MRNKLTILGLLSFATLLFLTCTKGIEKDKLYIRGRLFLLDTLIQNSNNQPLANKKVTLSYSGTDLLNYLYSDSTDNDGYFTFNLLSMDQKANFTLRFEDSISSYLYTAKAEAKGGDNQVALIATLNEFKVNGFIVRLIDNQKESIPNVSLRIYNNKTLAEQNDANGAIETVPSNQYGKTFRLKLPAGTYYLNASKIIDTITYIRIAKPISLEATGIKSDTMELIKKTTPVINGFTVRITDTLGGNVPTSIVRVYASLVVAQTNNTSAAIYNLIADSLGMVSKTNIASGNYYFNASIQLLDTLKLQRIGKLISVNASGIKQDTIIMRLSN